MFSTSTIASTKAHHYYVPLTESRYEYPPAFLAMLRFQFSEWRGSPHERWVAELVMFIASCSKFIEAVYAASPILLQFAQTFHKQYDPLYLLKYEWLRFQNYSVRRVSAGRLQIFGNDDDDEEEKTRKMIAFYRKKVFCLDINENAHDAFPSSSAPLPPTQVLVLRNGIGAYVVPNEDADESPFAADLVVLSRGKIILLQCKLLSNISAPVDFEREFCKMGIKNNTISSTSQSLFLRRLCQICAEDPNSEASIDEVEVKVGIIIEVIEDDNDAFINTLQADFTEFNNNTTSNGATKLELGAFIFNHHCDGGSDRRSSPMYPFHLDNVAVASDDIDGVQASVENLF